MLESPSQRITRNKVQIYLFFPHMEVIKNFTWKKNRKIEKEVSTTHWSYFYLIMYKKHCSITLEGDSQGNLLLWWWWLFCLFCFVFSEAFMILWLKQESKYFDLCYPTQACGLSCSTIYSYLRQVLTLLPIPAEWSISPQSFLYLGESYGQVRKDRWPRELEAAPQ